MPPASASLILPCSAAGLLPHRRPVRLIDRLLNWNDGAGQAEATIAQDSPLIAPCDCLDRSAMIEMMAQAYAAGKGWEGRQQGQGTPRIGYLVAIRDFVWTADARAGDRLLVSVATEGRFGDFRVVAGRICRQCDHLQLARGELRLWRGPVATDQPDQEDPP